MTEQNMTMNRILKKLDLRDVTSMTLKRAAVNFALQLIGTEKKSYTDGQHKTLRQIMHVSFYLRMRNLFFPFVLKI